jgi:hypothetical protein
MDFYEAVNSLNKILAEKQPSTFSSSWIYFNAPGIYHFVRNNYRTENDLIDWDIVTGSLNRAYAKRWTRYRYKQIRSYEKQSEVDAVLTKYKDKLYTFFAPASDSDKQIQDRMIIRLVRIGQRGNISAQEELVQWVTYVTDDWIDHYPQMYRWKGYEDEVPDKIRACIRCYRYTGSFLGYLFKTLEYSARGKPSLVSLDDKILDGAKTRIEYARAEE